MTTVSRVQRVLAQYGLGPDEVQTWMRQNGNGQHQHQQQPQMPYMMDMDHGQREVDTAMRDWTISDPTRTSCPVPGNSLVPRASEQLWSLEALAAGALAISCNSASGDSNMGVHRSAEGSPNAAQHLQGRHMAQLELKRFEQSVDRVVRVASDLIADSHSLPYAKYMKEAEFVWLDKMRGLLSRVAVDDGGATSDAPQPLWSWEADIKHVRPFVSSNESEHSREFQSEPKGQSNLSGARSRRRNHRQDQLAALRKWVADHSDEPYPTPEEKADLAVKLCMEIRQIEHCARRAPLLACVCCGRT